MMINFHDFAHFLVNTIFMILINFHNFAHFLVFKPIFMILINFLNFANCLNQLFSHSKWVLHTILYLTVSTNCVFGSSNFDTTFLSDSTQFPGVFYVIR